jgi:hypothetical protein
MRSTVLLALVVLLPLPARAQTEVSPEVGSAPEAAPEPSPAPSPWRNRTFGVGPHLGLDTGNGVIARARLGHVGLDASFGFLPLFSYALVQHTGASSDSCSAFDFEATVHGTLSALVFFTDPDKRVQLGLGAGGAWNSFLKWGGLLEFLAEVNWRPDISFIGGIGFAGFPGGAGRVAKPLAKTCPEVTGSEVFPRGTFQLTLGVGMLYYFR